MPAYKAPIRDIQFVLYELLNVQQDYALMTPYQDVDRALIDDVLETAAQFAQCELAPLNRSGDEEGCCFDNGTVTTPQGFKAAYKHYVDLGYSTLTGNPLYGGQGLPSTVGHAAFEMFAAANMAWTMYSTLSHGAIRTIECHGTDAQKQQYLPKIIAGVWTGTMCLTEAHAGSDLGIIRTKAEPNVDGSFAISGTKIFISAGEHDLAENIVHVVLARLPNAPSGTKGISLFLVPKFLVNADGSLGKRNQVYCGSIEHKMGIKASPTCVMNFDQATGYLIGTEHKGLHAMFTFMNSARIGTAIQGVTAAELAFQGSIEYARERLAMRSLSGVKAPEQEADPIIVHPAVRQMLLTQKAFAEGGRALVYFLSVCLDKTEAAHDADEQQYHSDLLSLLTPIAKAFLTEVGYESANKGVQVYGGHGFIREWGMEQIVRDTRISTLYEGTTEIQALDLLVRKVLKSQGKLLRHFTTIIHQFCEKHEDNADMQLFIQPLRDCVEEWHDLTMNIGLNALQNVDEAGTAAVDYLFYSGYVTLAYLWARMAYVAQQAMCAGSTESIYVSKMQTAQFYFQKILPRVKTHAAVIQAGSRSVMQMDATAFTC